MHGPKVPVYYYKPSEKSSCDTIPFSGITWRGMR
jgi:hypothetical protein